MCSQLFHEMGGILWKSDANPLTIHGQRPTRSLDALDYTPCGLHNSTSITRFSGIMSLTNPI
jgi:hypothetical protein